jgi:hypothetical protein
MDACDILQGINNAVRNAFMYVRGHKIAMISHPEHTATLRIWGQEQGQVTV